MGRERGVTKDSESDQICSVMTSRHIDALVIRQSGLDYTVYVQSTGYNPAAGAEIAGPNALTLRCQVHCISPLLPLLGEKE